MRVGNRMAIIGTAFLASAIVLALYVITDVLFTTNLAVLTGIAALVVFGGLWYLVPMVRRSSSPEAASEDQEDEPADSEQAQDSRGASSRR